MFLCLTMKSTMKAVAGFVMLLVAAVSSDMVGECDMAGFYTELGCTPVPSADGGLCPDAFQCPELHPDPTKCYYRGVAYGDKQSIPQGLMKDSCSVGCSCSLFNGEARFSCAEVDCVENLNSDIQEQCIWTYKSVDSCCSTGTVCGKDAIAQLKICEVDGKTYREGETFQPLNTKKTCICNAEWNGTIDDASCKDIVCGVEIHNQYELLQNCAPVFYGSSRDCPIGFECPKPDTKVIRGLNIRNLSSQCIFGNMTLSVGDEVTVVEKCTKCTCNVPPFVNCVQKICD